MVYAWPGLISARLAESPAGVCDTTQAFALSGSNVAALAVRSITDRTLDICWSPPLRQKGSTLARRALFVWRYYCFA